MKQLICEMCGNNNLLKQDGVFVCEYCGCKYTVEEAKKMMVEGKIDVSGSTIKVDSSEKLSNLYKIARRAKKDNNSESAAKYYDLILQEDPMSWEASFYTTYYSAMQTKIIGIESAAIKVNNCIDTILQLIHDNVEEKEQYEAVSEVVIRVKTIASMLRNAAFDHYKGIDYSIINKYTQEYINRASATTDMMYNLGNQIEAIFETKEDFCSLAVIAWKDGITKHQSYLILLQNKEANKKTIESYQKKIGKYDQEYKEQHEKEILTNKIQTLRNKIVSNDNLINKLENIGDWNKRKIKGAIFIGICAVGMMFIGFNVGGAGEIFVLLGQLEIFIAIVFIITSKVKPEEKEKNRKEMEELKEDNKKIKKELKELEKKEVSE